MLAGYSPTRAAMPGISIDGTAMGEIVNLHKARKRAARERDGERAASNRLTHGRTKAERSLETARSENADLVTIDE